MRAPQLEPVRGTRRRRRLCLSPRNREERGCCAGRSITPLQRGGFAFLDRRGLLGSGVRLVVQKLARQALLPDHRVRVRRLTAAGADIGEPVLGTAQAEIGRLLARLAGPRLFDGLAGLLVLTLLLQPGGAALPRGATVVR